MHSRCITGAKLWSTCIRRSRPQSTSGFSKECRRSLDRIAPSLDRSYAQPSRTTPTSISIICDTDGSTTDDVGLRSLCTRKKLGKLDAPVWQTGVQCFQIGSDKKASTCIAASQSNGSLDLSLPVGVWRLFCSTISNIWTFAYATYESHGLRESKAGAGGSMQCVLKNFLEERKYHVFCPSSEAYRYLATR